jgi:hypothetical protein
MTTKSDSPEGVRSFYFFATESMKVLTAKRVPAKDIWVYNMDMKFPQDLLRFLYWIFFKPFSLYTLINQLDRTIGNATALLLTRSHNPSVRSIGNLALVYVLIVPWLLALGTGVVLSQLGMDVNRPRLMFYLSVAMALSLTFNISFSIAFLLPFSIAVVIWSSTSFTQALGILFSLMLGLAYGLTPGSARWGLTAGLVYGAVFGILFGPLIGLSIGMAFLIGYFRIFLYVIEAPLSWILGALAPRGDPLKLWQFHPMVWDELIWFPLPGLDQHLLAIKKQNGSAAQAAILHVQESFQQRWTANRMLEKE